MDNENNKKIEVNEYGELIEFLDGKFGKIDGKFEKIDERFEKIDERFEKIDERFDGIETDIRAIKQDVNILKEGAFTKDEKESVLASLGQYDKRLENESTGKDNITLTRPEYDSTAVVASFDNRFTE